MPLLDWLNKDEAIKAASKSAYRLLEEVPELSYGDAEAGNLLIQGDNLEALKALLPFYAGKVKCVFIDPPYNTKSAFEHYDDNLEHSIWLSTIYPRLELLRELMAEDGSIWVTIDDNEAHYLKVLMDEIFGRRNFVINTVWQKKFSPQNDEKLMTSIHDHIVVYAKNIDQCSFNKLERTDAHDSSFKNPDNDPRGLWSSGDLTSKTKAKGHSYPIQSPSGDIHYPPAGRQWAPSEDTYNKWLGDNRIWFGKLGKNKPRIKQFLSEMSEGIVPVSIWMREDVGDNQDAKRETKKFNSDDIFDTPKPERLMQRIIHLATDSGDLVLDSFVGSGTTAAVAHKMERKYIAIEIGEHALTHSYPRLKEVVEGEQGGISSAVDWQGGGGFRFVRLGQRVFDEFGLLNPDIKFATLASHVWFIETRQPLPQKATTPLIGVHDGVAYYLLYNGILGDKRPQSGNVLTSKILDVLPEFDGPKVIYGETTRLGESRLAEQDITFKQIPYDVKAL
ncbi:site-specific DNA-methyltransferase [Methylophaga thalassica]|uniref:site-specific DNA-methyltransferase n=1 Tax=Methylophaga aminisulfidivorans TaxID=230105 RepID=UPI003A8C9765